MRRFVSTLSAIVMITSLASLTSAQTPTNMNIQGRLHDGAGAPVSPGLKNFTFKIFDQQVGGTEVWPAGPGEIQTITTSNEGLWTAAIGTNIALPSSVFADTTLWLQISVDDGVLPPETLDRMKLNTSPFAFHSATLGGQSLTDLTDDFVNVTGDSMSGELVVAVSAPNTASPPLTVRNLSDGHAPFPYGLRTFGLAGDVASNGSEAKFGVIGTAAGTDGQATGVIGEAHGRGTLNIGVFGFTSDSADFNYAAWFVGGDLLHILPDHPGDSAVRLPWNSIASDEILDEPGIAHAQTISGLTLVPSNTSQDFVSVTLTTPDWGYIVLEGDAYLIHNGDSSSFGWIQISETSTAGRGAGVAYRWTGYNNRGGVAADYDYQTATMRKVYEKTAGTHTFYFQGNAYTSNDGTSSIALSTPTTLTATYYPRSYGMVATTVVSPDGFESAQAVTTTDPLTHETSTAYQVDLRELELKMERERREAQQAEMEYLRAQMKVAGPRSAATRTDD